MSLRRLALTGICIGLGVALAAAALAGAEIPKKINYQGRLTDSDTGEPLPGTHTMTFHIYSVEFEGTPLWTETQSVYADSSGVVSTTLGNDTPIDIAFTGPMWLEVEVGGETLAPRREIVSVPFAFRAEEAEHAANADSLAGQSSDSYSLVGHTHTEYVTRDEVSSITSDMITDGEITDDDIAPGAEIDPTKIAGSAWTSDNDGSGSGLDADMVDGLHADAFADTIHSHSELYFTKEELHTPGELNNPDNPVNWTKLTGVPDGFADGLDDTGAGDGHSLDAADGDPVDALYVDNDGDVGIGKTAAAEKLDVDGSINLSEHLKVDATTVLSVDGTANTFVGQGAGVSNTGTGNTFLGSGAGYLNGLGFDNVFVGDSAGFSNTQGFYNVFVGNTAGRSNSFGQDNTFAGARAGNSNDQGSWNTFIGAHAGNSNVNATSNTFVGAGAGAGNVSGSDNTYVGHGAGGSNVTGSGNTCIGSFTGPYGNCEGNVLIGRMAGLNEEGSNKLYLANGPESTDVLIYGDFSTGNVGLGTLDPDKRLHVSSPVSNFGMVMLENSNFGDNEASIGFKEGSDAGGSEIWVAGVGGWGNTSDFVIGRAATKMLITPDGNMGVGSLNPQARVDANTGTGVGVKGRSEDDDGVVGRTEVAGKSGVFGHSDDGYGVTGRSDNSFGVAAVGGGDDSGYDSVGDLLLGGTYGEIFSFGTLLNIYSNGTIDLFLDNDDNGTDVFSIWKGGGGSVFEVDEDGDVQVTGDLFINWTSSMGYDLYVNGTAFCTTTWASSDARFKRDIEGIENALDKVRDLRGVRFTWNRAEYADKGFPEGQHYGVVAQEVEEILPEIVRENPDGEKAVAYSEIIPVLIEAIKSQQEEIEDLRAQIEDLR